jgi:hypothetical protein
MLKEPPRAVGGAGGPLSALHVAAGSGATNLAAASRTTAPAWTTVNGERTFLETLRRSAVTQFVWHDCDTTTRRVSSKAGQFMAE